MSVELNAAAFSDAKGASLPRRYYALDGMRGFAAILVILNHIGMNNGLSFGASGYLAVDFFFALSGFVIGLAYEERLKSHLGFVDFMAARIIRLYPLLLIGLIFGIMKYAGQVAMHDPQTLTVPAFIGSFVTGALMLPANIPGFTQYFPAGQTIMPLNTPAWSLFFEMVANIAFGAFLYRLSTMKLGIFVALSGVLFAYGILQVTDKSAGVLPFAFGWGFPRVFFTFCLGMLMHRLLSNAPRRMTQLAHFPAIALVVILMIAPAAGATRAFELAAIFIVIPAILTLGAQWEVPESLRKPYGVMGDISYPVYIMHFPLLMTFLAIGHMLHLPLWLMTATFIVGMSVFAYMMLKLYDEPVRAWLTRRWRARREAQRRTQALKSGIGWL